MSLLALVAAGCAMSGEQGLSRDAKCAVIGAAAGAAAGALVDGEVGGGLVGAGAGAVLGTVFCAAQAGDSDGDGVPDDLDKCPNTPQGAVVDADGCPVDSDGDGVPDGLDQCPDTPKGAVVDATGCPIDSDGDGVPDGLDQCPNSPKGWSVDSRGCPVPIVLRNVNFEHDQSRLTAEAMDVLNKAVVPVLTDNPAVRVRIVGHTDSQGTEAYNQALSVRRANSVRDYLATKGVASNRMVTEGKGESEPVAPNNVAEGRAANRRVEFFAIK